MKLDNLMVNRIINPLGFNIGKEPHLSWTICSDSAKSLAYTRIEVALDEQFNNIIFDSGKKEELDNLCYPLKIALEPCKRYYWRVSACDEKGEAALSDTAWFETSKLDVPWKAQWITPDFDSEYHPLLFTDFEVNKEVVNGRAYICGLGLYEMSINGKKAGDEYLSPGYVAYDKWLPYQTYDITDLIKNGSNHIDVMLGNGWYKGRFGLRNPKVRYGDDFALICEIVLSCSDGTTQIIHTTPDTWQAKRSQVMESSIYDGEVFDSTFESDIYATKTIDISMDLLQPRRGLPIKIMERVRPIEIINTPAGETVIDMGQNMVGWLEFVCKAPKGFKIHLQFGETLQQDNFYRDNLRTAKCEYIFYSDGSPKTVRPMFTFYGFRYVKLSSWYGEASLDDFSGCVMHSDMKRTGSITTSDPLVNKLFKNALWGQKGNFLDVPTDCPQRDERMGWTGDAQMFFGTAAFNMDVYAFFNKFCYDLMLEQEKTGGNVPVVIPRHAVAQLGSSAWGDAATIIPWNMYVYYGDKSILEQQYPSMKAWVDYIYRRDEENGGTRLWIGDFHYGDWLSLDGDDPSSRFGGTDSFYIASAYYRYSSLLVSKAAEVLGLTDDVDFYKNLSNEVLGAIQKNYFTAAGRLAIDTQTAYVIALYMELVPEQWKEKTAYALRRKLKDCGNHLRTGFVGTPYLCRVLSKYGSNDIAYKLLMQKDYPSWLYPVLMGATTIWERWNSILPDGSISDTGMNSLNHYAYGSIVEWIYRNAAGIQPMESAPGFRRFMLAPQPHYLLKSVEARFDSPFGEIVSAWNITENGELDFSFKIPFGTVAELTLPHAENSPYNDIKELSAGEYKFKYTPSIPYTKIYNLDTPFSDLYKNDEAKKIVNEALPDITSMMLFPSLAGERSINDFVHDGFINPNKVKLDDISDKLKVIRDK